MSNTQQAAHAAVAVTSDTSTLLRALAKTFTRGTIFVSELIQNARRAGATLIRVTITPEEFTVVDDGVGIADFSDLLAMAKSGWEESVQRSDRPYGLGWFAGLFNATSIEVISRGQRLAASTEHLLALRPVGLEPVEFTAGTTMTLRGHGRSVMDLERAVTHLASSYPVPIELNGTLLERPRAVDAPLDWVDIGIGLINRACLLTGGGYSLFLQGAPIGRDMHGRGSYRSTFGYLHLDSTQFEGRLPDRDCLIEPEKAHLRIEEAVRLGALREIEALRPGMTDEDFIGTYGERLAELQAWELLSSFDCVPTRWVTRYDVDGGRLALNSDCEDGWNSPEGAVVSRAELAARGVFSDDDHGEDVRAAAWVAFKGGYRVRLCSSGLDVHWLGEMVATVQADEITVRLEDPVGEPTSVDGSWADCTLRVAKRVFLVHATLGEVEVPSGEGVFVIDDGTIYARPDTAACVVYQCSDFLGENDYFREDKADEAQDAFEISLSRIINQDPTQTLTAFLRKGLPWSTPQDLRGQKFTVVFDDSGSFTVELVR